MSVTVHGGEVVALLGANGSGTSALVESLSGRLSRTAGTITVDGRLADPEHETHALAQGISTIAQQPRIPAPLLTAEVLYRHLPEGRAPSNIRAAARRAFSAHGVDLTGAERVGDLGDAEIALLELVRVLEEPSTVVLLDQTSAPLNGFDMLLYVEMVRALAGSGRAVLVAAHRPDEVVGICSRALILRRGELCAEAPVGSLERETLLQLAHESPPPQGPPPLAELPRGFADEILVVSHLSTHDGLRDVTLSVRAGEVLGIAGVRGSGAEALARALSEESSLRSGTISGLEDPRVHVWVEPTRGVDDVGRAEFRSHLREMTEARDAVLLASADFAELVHACQRIAVFHEGACVGVFDNEEVDEDRLVELSLAGPAGPAGSEGDRGPRGGASGSGAGAAPSASSVLSAPTGSSEKEDRVGSPAPGVVPSSAVAAYRDWPYSQTVSP